MSDIDTVNLATAHIRLLSEQVDSTYQATKRERKALSRWEENQSFSILGVLELYSSDIQGYAESLMIDQPINNQNRALSHLRNLDAFQVDYFSDWYLNDWQTYLQTKLYVEQLDYLRLRLIEYFRAKMPVAA